MELLLPVKYSIFQSWDKKKGYRSTIRHCALVPRLASLDHSDPQGGEGLEQEPAKEIRIGAVVVRVLK